MTDETCTSVATSPITRVVRGNLTQLGGLLLNENVLARDGWWPELDSVSWTAQWQSFTVGGWESPPSALFFFYAWDRDEFTASTTPPTDNADASLAIVDTDVGLIDTGGGGGRSTFVQRWERYRVDIPARSDNGSLPCQLAAGLFLVNPGSFSGGPTPMANGAIRVTYRYRRTCGQGCK